MGAGGWVRTICKGNKAFVLRIKYLLIFLNMLPKKIYLHVIHKCAWASSRHGHHPGMGIIQA